MKNEKTSEESIDCLDSTDKTNLKEEEQMDFQSLYTVHKVNNVQTGRENTLISCNLCTKVFKKH